MKVIWVLRFQSKSAWLWKMRWPAGEEGTPQSILFPPYSNQIHHPHTFLEDKWLVGTECPRVLGTRCHLQRWTTLMAMFQDTGTQMLLTAVDNLDASVISRFPFRPTKEGTKVRRSCTSVNTGQCWWRRERSSVLVYRKVSQKLLEQL